jgi:hypothetical protein
MKAGMAALTNAVSEAMVPAFQATFWVAALLLVLTLIPALFMPRRHEVSHLAEGEQDSPAPVILH